jgi:phage/plasmid-associated DNA primase
MTKQDIGDAFARAEELPFGTTEFSLAETFARICFGRFRYVAELGKWFEWIGTVWRRDKTLNVYTEIRRICKQVADQTDKPLVAVAIRKAKTVSAVEHKNRLCR